MNNYKDNSVKNIDPLLRGYILRDFLEKNGLIEEVNNNIIYGTYTTMEEMDGIGGHLSEAKHQGWNYLGKGLEKNPWMPKLTNKPTIMDNDILQLLVCDKYGILTKEDLFKSYDELQTQLSEKFIEQKMQERERVTNEIAKLQKRLESIDDDLLKAKVNSHIHTR